MALRKAWLHCAMRAVIRTNYVSYRDCSVLRFDQRAQLEKGVSPKKGSRKDEHLELRAKKNLGHALHMFVCARLFW